MRISRTRRVLNQIRSEKPNVAVIWDLGHHIEKERELEFVAIWREVATHARDIEQKSNASVKREI